MMTQSFRNKLYEYVSTHLEQHASSPSFSEITEAMKISPRSKSLITRTLRTLEKEGRLHLSKEGRRLSISLHNKKIPLLGKISAGTPIEAIPDCEFLDIDTLFPSSNCFALQVNGTSMIDDGILDGDIIICKKADTAVENDIVVALIDQHNTTLKRISYRMKGMVTLIPANTTLKPRAYMPERINIQGIYVGLIRTKG